MSRYNDPEIQRDRARGIKASHALRTVKRQEAEERNARTPRLRRKAARRAP